MGSEIGITIVTPGLVDSEITDTEFMSKVSSPILWIKNTLNVKYVVVSMCCKVFGQVL